MNELRLYTYEREKPLLTDDFIEHYGVKGMKWGVRKDGSRSTGKGVIKNIKKKVDSVVKKKQGATNREEALKTNDLNYINSHKHEFTTNELNNVANRVQAEQRISQLAYNNSTKAKVRKILKSPAFKVVATVSVAALAVAGATIYANVKSGKTWTQTKKDIPKNVKNVANRYVRNQIWKRYKDFVKEPKEMDLSGIFGGVQTVKDAVMPSAAPQSNTNAAGQLLLTMGKEVVKKKKGKKKH